MPEHFRLVIPMLPPAEFSGNSRAFWAEKYKAGKEFEKAVWAVCRDAINTRYRDRPWVPFSHVVLNLVVVVKEERRRDADNLRARFKPGQDSLVLAELVPDDSPDRLTIATDIKVLVDPYHAPMTIIDIEGERSG